MEGTVTIRFDRNMAGEPRVTFTDTGPGISAEDRETLFRPFAKGSARPTGSEQSTGIGLYVARSLVEKLGGTLTLAAENRSENENLSTGATFLLTLSEQ